MSRKRHEEKCNGRSWTCAYCGSILSSERRLNNHESLCKKRAEDRFHDGMRSRERVINDRLERQQLDQCGESGEERRPRRRVPASSSASRAPVLDEGDDEAGRGDDSACDGSFECEQCRKRFTNVKTFQTHRRSHFKRKERSFACRRCQRSFPTTVELASHLRADHGLDIADNTPVLKCCDCDETFDAHHKLHAHRMSRHTRPRPATRLDASPVEMQWEKDPDVDPPWITRDGRGNRVTQTGFSRTYRDNRGTIHASHDPGVVRGVYNFPVDDFDGRVAIMRPHVEQIFKQEKNAFKINTAFGVILRNIETGEYRYFTAYYNNTVLEFPYRISHFGDINDFLRALEDREIMEHVLDAPRASTKWQKVYVTNATYFVYRMGHPIGDNRGRRTVPDYLRHHKVVSSLDTDRQTGRPYTDNLCAFRCLAFSVGGRKQLQNRTKAYYDEWREYRADQGVIDLPRASSRFRGIHLDDLPDFEMCFKVRTSVYSLHGDGACTLVYHTSNPDDVPPDRTLYLNLWERHFSLITNFATYAKKFACRFCRRVFDQTGNLSRHEKACDTRVKFNFPGGIYTPSATIFDELQETVGIRVEPELQFYPWFAVYDFEAVLREIAPLDGGGETTQWTTDHVPVAVSVASNVEGYSDPKCFVDDDPDHLVKLMCEYLEEIQTRAHELGRRRWVEVTDELDRLKHEFPTADVTTETMNAFNGGRDDASADPAPPTDDERGEEPMELGEAAPSRSDDIGATDYLDSQKLHGERVERLVGRFQNYVSVLPVLGFNSSKYDLNLIKKYFPKHLGLATDCQYVVKKTNQYTAVVTSKFKFLDILNYLAAGCNYSKFLKAYDVQASKSYFPYEWFDDVDKLNDDRLPPYDAFFSKLKNANVLQMEYAEWETRGKKTSPPPDGRQKYDALCRIWTDEGMRRFEDFLVYYANLDTGPFVEAAEKLQKYYFDMGVDVFKVAISAPGVARQLLFKHAKANDKYFASFGPEHEDLYHKFKKCAFGGPSIIFKRYVKVGETLIRDDPAKVCGNIVGYDCNGLYLWALGLELPVLFPVRRLEETHFKPEVSWRHLEMYQWMNWRAAEDGVRIQHKLNSGKEFPVGPYRLDGFSASETGGRGRGYEFHGCWTHGHDPSVCTFNRDRDGNVKFDVSVATRKLQERKRIKTEEREAYIRARNIDLTVTYECQFARAKKENPKILEHSRRIFPECYLRFPGPVSAETVLENVESGALTGFVQVDIRVPDVWPRGRERDVSPYDHFSEMAPIFCNAEVHFNEWGETMQHYSLSRVSGDFSDSRKLLVGGMAAEKIFLATNLLKWYLLQGLEVTRVYDVVEYRFEKCFEGFCDYISTARRAGDADPSKEILGETCKVLGNASYGSLLLDKTKHTNVNYVHDVQRLRLAVNDPCFKTACALPGDLYEIEKSKKSIDLDIPIQLAFAILQSAKLKLLEFYYDCLDYYIDRKDFEITHADTDSLYFAMSGALLEDVIKPSKKVEFERSVYGHCYDEDACGEPFRASSEHWFPRLCCDRHYKHDKRERGLFKLEASGTELIALASKTYHLTRPDDPDSVKAKGINRSALVDPRDTFMAALVDKEIGSARNVGFRARQGGIMTYNQVRKGFNYFYVKRKVLPDGINTVPLTMTLSPWEDYNVLVLNASRDCLSNDYQSAIFKHGIVFKTCTQLFMYEMAVYHDAPRLAVDMLKARDGRKMMNIAKSLKVKPSWYADRERIMQDVVRLKIDNIKQRVVLELRECGTRQIVQPGERTNGYFTCGLSQRMAEITNPLQFPGSNMMSVFWHNMMNDDRFMRT